ncbi:T3JAM protein, partial [Urocolius indicus]|nr:T3JAM protein [Urocolius indicus]
MISQPPRVRPRHRRTSESYDEKCERRHETRENLRRRNNVTSCRHLSRAVEEPAQSPRQREFLRRRNLASDAGRTALGQRPKAHGPPEPSWCGQRALLQQDSLPLVPLELSYRMLFKQLFHPTSDPSPTAEMDIQTEKPQPLTRASSASSHFAFTGTQTLTNPRARVQDSSQQTDPCQLCRFPLTLSRCSLQEALHRELLLKQKMVILQELFSTLLQASEKSWQGQLNEDKLKCKLRALENQLQACTQSYSKECVKKILIEMEDQKQTYEQKAKEALQKMLEDKLQTEQQLQNSQRSLAATREDLAFWKEHYTTLKAELTKMTTVHTELTNSFHISQSELQRVDAQNEQLRQALQRLQSEHAALHQQASALREDNYLKAEHISTIEDKLQKEENQKVTLEATISHLHNLIEKQSKEQKPQEQTEQRKDQVFTTQTPPLTPAKENQNTLLEHLEEGKESLKAEMQEKTSQLTAKENECSELRAELEALSQEYSSCLSSLRHCRHELNRFQSKRAERGHWIPLLVAVIAMAIATFLASYRP